MELKEVNKNILDLQEIQILAQLIYNMLAISEKLENSYNKKDGEEFNKSKDEILSYQGKIVDMLA